MDVHTNSTESGMIVTQSDTYDIHGMFLVIRNVPILALKHSSISGLQFSRKAEHISGPIKIFGQHLPPITIIKKCRFQNLIQECQYDLTSR